MALGVAKGVVRLEAGAMAAEQLEFRPRALVLWWCREQPAGGAGGIGFATDGEGEASTAWAADDAVASGVLSRVGSETALLLHDDPRTTSSAVHGGIRFADRGFSVHCEREPERPWLVHYLAVGGSELHGAAVRSFVFDGTDTLAVKDLGFQPGLLLATVGAGAVAREPQPGLAVAFGAAAGPSRQVAAGVVAHAGAGRTIVRGAQCTGAVAVLPAASASGEIGATARLVSLDPDGFTLEGALSSSELPLAVLALAGGRATVGLGDAASRRTSVELEPAGALLFGTGLTATAQARDIGRLCLGGFSRNLGAGCVSWSVRARGAWPLDPRSRSSAEAAFEVVDTTTGEPHARATLSGIGRRRFSLAWPVRDRYPRNFGYVAFGSERSKPTLRDRLRLHGLDGSLRE
jgi:hypothetical protein